MSATDSLTCREIVELVTDYIEGALDPDTTSALEAHLKLCPGCDRYVEQIRETVSTLGEISSDDLSAETRAGLLQAFRGFHRPVADGADDQ